MSSSYYHCVSEKYPLSGLTIGDALRKLRPECAPDLELFTFTGTNERLTVEQLVTQTLKDAKGMMGLGLKKGDLICLLGVNSSTFCSLACAAGYIGLQFSGAFIYEPHKHTSVQALNMMEAKLVLIGSEHKGKILKETADLFQGDANGPGNVTSEAVPSVRHLFCDKRTYYDFDVDSKFLDLDVMERIGGAVSDDVLEKRSRMTTTYDPFLSAMSSGSTGQPKRIVLPAGVHVQPSWTDPEGDELKKNGSVGSVTTSIDDSTAVSMLFYSIMSRHRTVFIHSSTSSIDEPFVREILEAVQQERCDTEMLMAALSGEFLWGESSLGATLNVGGIYDPHFLTLRVR